MKKLYIVLILILCSDALIAQIARTNIWYFGNHAGLDFNSGVPVALFNSAMDQWEGSSTISDDNGNLLFYTNGVEVYNKLHVTMPNGMGLFGDQSTTQSALIVPKPGSTSLYYIFTLAQQGGNNGLCYSIVDMTLDNGNGDVTIKNTIVQNAVPLTEKLCGTFHANGQDVWIAVHGDLTDAFFVYLVSATGVSSPNIINIGTVHTGSASQLGYMKFSPNGNKLAVAMEGTPQMDLLDFDNSTGMISNAATFTGPLSWTYGVEFSPASSKLYAGHGDGSGGFIYQFDMTAGSNANIITSAVQVNSNNFYPCALQSASDGKIYVGGIGSSWIGCINAPEIAGNLCNVVMNTLSLGTGHCNLGLPNFISNYLSTTTGINEGPADNTAVTVYPNPFTSSISVSLQKQSNIKEVNITVKNILGQTVFKKLQTSSFKLQTTFDLSFLSKGIYLFEITIDGEQILKKLVKE